MPPTALPGCSPYVDKLLTLILSPQRVRGDHDRDLSTLANHLGNSLLIGADLPLQQETSVLMMLSTVPVFSSIGGSPLRSNDSGDHPLQSCFCGSHRMEGAVLLAVASGHDIFKVMVIYCLLDTFSLDQSYNPYFSRGYSPLILCPCRSKAPCCPVTSSSPTVARPRLLPRLPSVSAVALAKESFQFHSTSTFATSRVAAAPPGLQHLQRNTAGNTEGKKTQ
ncbi:hypothetical protein B296_00031268 [Ensete ventricosum]|uniref:Uncharacterized protein n=1 Tax=Ensete ventricosum TaxID=4639 RepID=A0A426Y4U2_ENSVE|nr:hypothetical protein B296_00031268 [Ensete ventricosum]